MTAHKITVAERNVKRCTRCRRVRRLTEFHRHARTLDGRNSRCKACVLAAGQESRRRKKLGLSAKRLPIKQLPTTHCWIWLGGKRGPNGYGGHKHQYAHRVIYEEMVGPVPDGMELDHLCRNRRCVNPGHLEPVTHQENILRGESPFAKHARKTHCIHGHPLSGNNLYLRPDGKGRECRTCKRRTRRAVMERTGR